MGDSDELRIDPIIVEKQKDWADLYDSSVILDNPTLVNKDPEFSEANKLKVIKENFSMANRGKLAYIWFHHVVEGSNIFYPSDEKELILYQIRQSVIYAAFVEAWVAPRSGSFLAVILQCFCFAL